MKPIKTKPSFLRKTITSCLRKLHEYYKHPLTLTIVATALFFIFILLIGTLFVHLILFNIFPEICFPEKLGITKNNEECNIGVLTRWLGVMIGSIVMSIVTLLVGIFVNKGVSALDKTADAQEKRNVEERYKNAITQFVNTNPSIRLAGAYGFYHLAKDNEDRRRNICDVLCVYIRGITTSKTLIFNGESYSEIYKAKPSDEVQSILDLLTNKNYERDFPFKSDWINLENAYLNGANLREAQLQGANLTGVQLQWANLQKAQFQGAKLMAAQLQWATLYQAQIQGTDLRYAQLQVAILWEAQFQGANLKEAQLQGANLIGTWLQGANLIGTWLQGANLWEAQIQGANLSIAQLQGANLNGARLQGTNLSYAQFQGANLNKTDFSGAFTEKDISIDSAIERLKARRNQKDELKNVTFSGGVTQRQLDDFKKTTAETLEELNKIKNYNQNKINDFIQKMNKVVKILEDHDENKKKASYKFPREYIKTIKKGVYPKAEADKIIAMLEKIKNELAET